MTPKSKSALNGSTLDIGHLEREVHADVAKYQQHKAEDGMKKRAIHISKDYSEFRNFVSVSQLRPTPGLDVSRLFNGACGSNATSVRSKDIQEDQASIGGFDDIIKKRKEMLNPLKSVTKFETIPRLSCCENGVSNVVKSSRSAHDFLGEWRVHCTDAKATLSFLSRMDPNVDIPFVVDPEVTCKDYFSTEIDSDVMGDIVDALHLLVTTSALGSSELLMTEANVSTFVHSWLKAFSSCGRFELSVSFLSRDQLSRLKEVCVFLRNSGIGDHEIIQTYHKTLINIKHA